jgi:hypothetical protein
MPELEEKAVNYSGTNVTVTTTTETLIISSGPVKVARQTCLVLVKAWAQLVTGTGTTAVTPVLHRGVTITGPVVGEANPETLKAAAGGLEPFMVQAIEERSNVDTVEYSLSLTQTDATANGLVGVAMIEVEILGG